MFADDILLVFQAIPRSIKIVQGVLKAYQNGRWSTLQTLQKQNSLWEYQTVLQSKDIEILRLPFR